MNKKAFFKEFPKEKVLREIEELRAFVEGFDYTSLREVHVPEGDETFHRASARSTQQLFDFFCHHFLNSPDIQLKALYNGIDKWSVERNDIVILLGNLLMSFRNNIEIAEMEFFRKTSNNPDLGRLASNSTWVTRFQFLIEKHLDKMNVKGEYFDFIKNIQTLSERIFTWISKNSPEDIDTYKHLSSPEGSQRPAFDISDERRGIIKKLF